MAVKNWWYSCEKQSRILKTERQRQEGEQEVPEQETHGVLRRGLWFGKHMQTWLRKIWDMKQESQCYLLFWVVPLINSAMHSPLGKSIFLLQSWASVQALRLLIYLNQLVIQASVHHLKKWVDNSILCKKKKKNVHVIFKCN